MTYPYLANVDQERIMLQKVRNKDTIDNMDFNTNKQYYGIVNVKIKLELTYKRLIKISSSLYNVLFPSRVAS